MSTRKKVAIVVAALVCAPFLIAGMVAGARQSLDSKQSSVPSPSPMPSTSTPLASAHQASAAGLPTFAYPGDPQCAIIYRTHGKAAMSWTANVTLAGELITHASDVNGNIYRHDVHVTRGPKKFFAPVPLSRINDIGGILHVGSATYACSIAPQHHRARRHHRAMTSSTAPPTRAPPTPAPSSPPVTAVSCYPLSNEGTCYEPGEYCRDSDHGMTGVAGDGEKIICEDNDGWRWEPV